MGIHSDRRGSGQQWFTPKSASEYINRDGNSRTDIIFRRKYSNRLRNKFVRLIRSIEQRFVYNIRPWRPLSVHPELHGARHDEPNNNPASYHHRERNRHNLNIHTIGNATRRTAAIILGGVTIFGSTPVLAESVGGVSATANPIANSSGSVTNQAIQVLQGPYITNTYGGGVQCQGSTLNITPYIQYADSWKDPWEDFFMEPQYDMRDFGGRTITVEKQVVNQPWESWYDTNYAIGETITIEVDEDVADGVPDNPGDIIWHKPVRTDMKSNNSLNLGLSATWSIPMNKKFQKQCHEAAAAQISAVNQSVANKRLDFEIARLKNCGELMKAGIMFHPKSPYAVICSDVMVTTPAGQLIPHTHNIPRPNPLDKPVISGDASSLKDISIGGK